MFAKICILIENTPRSTAMPEGTGTFAVWARNRFLSLQTGVATFTHHAAVVFYAIGMFVLLYRPVDRLYIF